MIYFAATHKQKSELVDLILGSDKPMRIEIEEGEQRTITQNARHWALIQGASQYLRNAGIFDGSPEALHVYCKRQILGTKAVTLGDEVFYLDAASRKMTKKQFKLFDEKLEPFLLQELNVPFEYLDQHARGSDL
jgi:hypothetical protein